MPKRISAVSRRTFVGTIITDTREQSPYTFASLTCDAQDGGGPLTVHAQSGTLKSGDYSLAGYESVLAVERKSKQDAFGTFGRDRDRFERELQRLSSYRYAAVVVEATIPEILLDPPPFTEFTGRAMVRTVLAWEQRFPAVRWWFVGERRLSEVWTFRLLERFLKERLREKAEAFEPSAK